MCVEGHKQISELVCNVRRHSHISPSFTLIIAIINRVEVKTKCCHEEFLDNMVFLYLKCLSLEWTREWNMTAQITSHQRRARAHRHLTFISFQLCKVEILYFIFVFYNFFLFLRLVRASTCKQFYYRIRDGFFWCETEKSEVLIKISISTSFHFSKF